MFRWEAPFYFLAGLACLMWLTAYAGVPALRGHFSKHPRNPAHEFAQLLRDPNATRALLFMATLVFGHFAIIPLLPPYLVGNLGLGSWFRLPDPHRPAGTGPVPGLFDGWSVYGV